MRLIFMTGAYAASLIVMGIVSPSNAENGGGQNSGHAKNHDWYQGYTMKSGRSCCNNNDCRPIDEKNIRKNGSDWEIYVHGDWYKVPAGGVQSTPSKDGGYHACYVTGYEPHEMYYWVYPKCLIFPAWS